MRGLSSEKGASQRFGDFLALRVVERGHRATVDQRSKPELYKLEIGSDRGIGDQIDGARR